MELMALDSPNSRLVLALKQGGEINRICKVQAIEVAALLLREREYAKMQALVPAMAFNGSLILGK
jgi:hypothetical protein